MAQATREEYVVALRKAAQFLEDNPEVPVPFPQTLLWWAGDYQWADNPTEGSDGVRAFVAAAPRVAKDYADDDLWTVYDLGPLKLKYGCKREAVCERVVTGTRVIPAQPEQVIPATEERTEEIVEWRCHSLLAPREEEVAQ